jgi:hypothetical protein
MKTLEELYQEMYLLTHDHCGCESRPFRCCEMEHCEVTRQFAQQKYGIELKSTGHAIPFMGSDGCVVAPHLRPLCTLHSCYITRQAKAEFPNDPERTKAYFSLRNLILSEARKQGKFPFPEAA